MANLDTLFRRDFTLQRRAPRALLTVEGAKQIELPINDRKVELAANHNWKDTSVAEVSGLLQDGPNRIEARVFNDNGPPALWLSLTGDQLSLRSDQNWIASFAGSAWREATPAASPRFPGQGNSIESSERTVSSLTKVPCYGSAKAFYGLSALVPVSSPQPAGMLSLTEERSKFEINRSNEIFRLAATKNVEAAVSAAGSAKAGRHARRYTTLRFLAEARARLYL